MKRLLIHLFGFAISLFFLGYAAYTVIYLGYLVDAKNLSIESQVNHAHQYSWLIFFTSLAAVLLFALAIIKKVRTNTWFLFGALFLVFAFGLSYFTVHSIKQVEQTPAKQLCVHKKTEMLSH